MLKGKVFILQLLLTLKIMTLVMCGRSIIQINLCLSGRIYGPWIKNFKH